MVIDWLTAVGLVSTLVAAFAIGVAAMRGKDHRHQVRTALPPRFRALAAADIRDKLDYSCPTELPRT